MLSASTKDLGSEVTGPRKEGWLVVARRCRQMADVEARPFGTETDARRGRAVHQPLTVAFGPSFAQSLA